MTDHRPLVSVVCPAYHEQEVLPLFHQELGKILASLDTQYHFEIIYIDDGSRDGTLAAMQSLTANDARVRVLSLARNFGKEAALQAGLEHAEGDLIITMGRRCSIRRMDPAPARKSQGARRSRHHRARRISEARLVPIVPARRRFIASSRALSEIEIRKETSDFIDENKVSECADADKKSIASKGSFTGWASRISKCRFGPRNARWGTPNSRFVI